MRIDLDVSTGLWRIWDLQSGDMLATAAKVAIRVPCELVSEERGRRGFLIVAGRWRQVADTIVIE